MANDVNFSGSQTDTESLRAALRGDLLDPLHQDYDDVRVVWNAMINRRWRMSMTALPRQASA